MRPALILDAVVSKSARLHPFLLTIVRPILRPLIKWRLNGTATTLANEYRWLPATSWNDVEKHGWNGVYNIRDKTDVFTKTKKVTGVWAVDYKNKTVRTVLDAPEEYRKIGATF
jgi:hypothetical protein